MLETTDMWINGCSTAGTCCLTESLNPFTQKAWADMPDAWVLDVFDTVAGAPDAHERGDPMDPATTMVPAATAAQYKKALAMVQHAKLQGAEFALDGSLVWPTVLTNVKPYMRVSQDEVFGPVSADFEEGAIALTHGTNHGLATGTDTCRAHRAAAKLRVATVPVKAYSMVAPSALFGRIRNSSGCRENRPEGMLEFLKTKSVWVRLSGATRDQFAIG